MVAKPRMSPAVVRSVPLRLADALLGLLFLLLAFEAPAAAHFGAAHIDLPPIVMDPDRAALQRSPAQWQATAETACDRDCDQAGSRDCGSCSACRVHGHCHAPAVLGSRDMPARHVAAYRTAWGTGRTSIAKSTGVPPPVPPPNAA